VRRRSRAVSTGVPALAGAQRLRKIDLLKQILANDREIRDATDPWMNHIPAWPASKNATRKSKAPRRSLRRRLAGALFAITVPAPAQRQGDALRRLVDLFQRREARRDADVTVARIEAVREAAPAGVRVMPASFASATVRLAAPSGVIRSMK
jgi:hypothetical protein